MSERYYITNLDWGDGSRVEFTNEPKEFFGSLELFEHVYKRPGFYNISGLVFTKNEDGSVNDYEKFKSNILINRSKNYTNPFFIEKHFAMIGGFEESSSYFKTLLLLAGYDFEKNKRVNISDLKYNLLDKIYIIDNISKIDSKYFDEFVEPYTKPIYDGDELINNGFIRKSNNDILKNTGIKNIDVGSCKMYNGVRKMHKHLGFNNSHPAADSDNEMYWGNIIPKDWKWTDKEGVEYGVFREPISGSKALVENFDEYKIDDSATQNWSNGYWPELPKLNKAGKFETEVTSSYGFRNVAIGEEEGSGGKKNLVLDIDFNQDTVDDLTDKTSQFEIVQNFDYTVKLDGDNRVERDKKDNVELLNKVNSEQAF